MTASHDPELELLFLALSDPTRLRILKYIAHRESTVNSMVGHLSISQPKVSRHLAYLRSCHVVATRRSGKEVYYSLNRDLGQLSRQILELVLGAEPGAQESVAHAARPVSHDPEPERHSGEIEVYLL